MGYDRTNVAYAYDREAARSRPSVERAPRLDVYSGAGREANQAVSPVFLHVVKVFSVLIALFVAVGFARVAVAGATTARLDANASTYEALEEARDEGTNLEIMNSVYGSDSRIRGIALDSIGMVEADGAVTLDFSASADSAQASE